MESGKFGLKIRSKSGKFRAEIDIQCGKLNLKVLPVNNRLCGGKIGSPIPINRLK